MTARLWADDELAQWCSAFAAMTALELAEASGTSHQRVELFVALATAET